MSLVLVTGANGFVGRRLCHFLEKEGLTVRGAIRKKYRNDCDSFASKIAPIADVVEVGDIGAGTDWSHALKDVSTIVHLAARVHVMQEMAKNPLEAFRAVNVRGTEYLARMAAKHGVRRFVYVSSISVHGKSTVDNAYKESDEAMPHSPYAVSKWEAELALKNAAKEFDFELVIVRPPLVYGPGVGGNFLRLMSWADKGIPLPLGSVRNKRSFIGIENLADLLVRCVINPKAAGETFLVADGEDLSTPDLIRRVAKLLGRPARLLPCHENILRTAARILRKEDMLDRLCNCLQVDSGKAKHLLGWRPILSLDEGLKQTTDWYMKTHRK